VLVANCSPYTYSGSVGLDLVPEADFDGGLAYFAPVTLRARDLPRMLLHGVRGSGLKDGKALAGHDLDRIVVRCDEPLPLQVDGEDTGDVVEAVYEAERGAVTVLV
jgi:diacylglycerol kinase family enzyme